MSRYNKLIKEILDGIFEGYSLEDGKLKVVNESAAKSADGALHKLVLEKSRDLWDQLEAAEGSLSDVAEEISFEELNADPSSVDMTLHAGANEPAPQVDAAAAGETEPTLENLLGSDDFDLSSVFEGLDHLDDADGMADNTKGEPTMMEEPGADEEDVVDGDEDYENLEIGMDDNDMGSSDMEGDDLENGDMELEPENGEMDMELEPENGEGEMDLEPEGDVDAAFDFDLELGAEEPEGDELELEPEGEEEEAEEGYGSKPYDMEM